MKRPESLRHDGTCTCWKPSGGNGGRSNLDGLQTSRMERFSGFAGSGGRMGASQGAEGEWSPSIGMSGGRPLPVAIPLPWCRYDASVGHQLP